MHRRLASILLSAQFLVAAGAAHAGSLYIFASDRTIGDAQLRTFLEVTNPSDENRFIEVLFIPTFRDGTEREGEEPYGRQVLAISPHRTMQFAGLTGGQATGMLEVNADNKQPELLFNARLETRLNGARVDSAQIPVISSETNMFEGGDTAYVQGMGRSEPVVTSLGFINLDHVQNQCTIDLVTASGDELMDTVVLQFAPLSNNHWDDVFKVIQQDQVADAYASVHCEGPFAVHSFMIDTETGTLRALTSSASSASKLRKPGEEPPPEEDDPPADDPPGNDEPETFTCPDGATCFELPGIFHEPSPGNEFYKYHMPMEPGQRFSEIKLRLTFYDNGWHPRNPSYLHNFFWLFRNEWRSNTFGYVNAKGPGQNILQNTTNVDFPPGQGQRTKTGAHIEPSQTYVVDYSYNVTTRRITTVLSRLDGSIVAQLSEATTTRNIVTEGAGFDVWFGLEEVYTEVPWARGSYYKDFQIQFLP